MSLEEVTEKVRQKLSRGASMNARVKFDFEDEGKIFVDATQSPPALSHEDADADVTLLCALDTFDAILAGRQDPNIAFMMGKLKIKGSMGLAMKLNAMLED